MINNTISLVKEALEDYLRNSKVNGDVRIDNIGLLDSGSSASLDDSIVITLVNIEEESTLKNVPPVRKTPTIAVYQNPPVFLNLYILISCNYAGTSYPDALKRLSAVIRFFQSRNSFNYNASSSTWEETNPPVDLTEIKFTMELFTLSFEQINYLWGSLGGRQVPFVMYKLRLVGITERETLREVPLIEEIETKFKANI